MEARRRFNGVVPEPDHWFAVAAKREEASDTAAPEFVLEVLPHAEYVKAIFVDPNHTQRFAYGFSKTQDRLFMTNVTEHQYEDDGRFHPLNEAVRSESIVIDPGGYVKEVLYDYVGKQTHVSEYRGVDISGNWEDIPEFGDWERFGKFDR